MLDSVCYRLRILISIYLIIDSNFCFLFFTFNLHLRSAAKISTSVKTPLLATSKQHVPIRKAPTNAIAIQDGRELVSNAPILTTVHRIHVPTLDIAKSSQMARILPAIATAQDTKVNYATKISMNVRSIMEDATLSPTAPTWLDLAPVDLAPVATQAMVLTAASTLMNAPTRTSITATTTPSVLTTPQGDTHVLVTEVMKAMELNARSLTPRVLTVLLPAKSMSISTLAVSSPSRRLLMVCSVL